MLSAFIKETFLKFDTDGSGTLDRNEILVCLSALDSEEYRETFVEVGKWVVLRLFRFPLPTVSNGSDAICFCAPSSPPVH